MACLWLAFVGLLLSRAVAVNTVSDSAFVASDNSVTFALNIPQADESNDLYFTLSGSASSSWVAIGMGNSRMDGTLMFILYAADDGSNVTLSPRLSGHHVEPSYADDIGITVLPGSGVSNGIMICNFMCTDCRSWEGHSINANDTQAKFIFASGSGSLKSNSLSSGLRRHSSYGSFTMDLTKAYGKKGVPVITSDTSGSVQVSSKTDHDLGPPLHACAMLLAFVGLFPIGILILRIFNSPRWHGFTQALSAFVALVGVALGIKIGLMYQRTKNFTSAHQIFGIIITLAMIAQLVIGVLHHRIYKKTHASTKIVPVHVWAGRLIIPCGIINGFLGFPLAMNSKYNWALLALSLLVLIVLLPFVFWWYRRISKKKNMSTAGGSHSDTGYQSQPWIATSSRSDIHLNQMNSNCPLPGQHPATETRQFV